MKSTLLSATIVSLIFAFTSPLFGQDLQPIPTLNQRVTDVAGLLTPGYINQLERELEAFENQKGSQVAVLIVNTTSPEAIEQYSIRVVDQWKLGRENVDDGVLLLVAVDDRKLRIEVGYGLEGAITDLYAKRIIDQIIVPHFRDGDYFLGIEEGLESIMALIQGEELPEVTTSRYSNKKTISLFYFIGIIAAIFAVVIGKVVLSGKLGNTKSNLIILPLVFLVMWIVVNISAALFATFFAFVFLNGKGRGGGRRGGGYYGGYSSYGGGFSGGGFSGGFGGGGGGFGGGGASGGW